MEQRKIGNIPVSAVGLGCNNFGRVCDADMTARIVDAALDGGVTLFDTADIYGGGLSEAYLGKALRGKRHKAVIATKFGMAMGKDEAKRGASPRWIVTAVEDSLRRLKTDVIDLYQLHAPDPSVPIEETLDALNELVKDGKVREIGCSNFSGAQIEDAARASRIRQLSAFASVQNHLNLLRQDTLEDIAPACRTYGLVILPYFPLESGLLTGKYRRGQPLPEGTRLAAAPESWRLRFMSGRAFDRIEALDGFAKQRGQSLLALAMAWLLAEPLVASAIAGATKPEQIAANIEAAQWRLTEAETREAGALARA